jgi:hypothetical protein
MNDQDHSLSLSDPDRSLVLSHFLTNFLQNLASCHTALRKKRNRKRFWVREIFLHRKQLGEFHHLISQLERDDQKFYFRGIAIKKNPTCQAQTAAWREL